MPILYPPDTTDHQREARNKIEQMAAEYRASFAGQDYARRRAAALKVRPSKNG